MTEPIEVFVTYSKHDARYLKDDSLLGFLRGLEREGVRFWTDREIPQGALWGADIEQHLATAPIALVLVSQWFLDTVYAQDVEIPALLTNKAHLLPVILSPCEWRRHDWLSSRQFLPAGDKTIEEHYQDPGKRKRLFLEIREGLRQRLEAIRAERLVSSPASPQAPSPAQAPASTAAAAPGLSKLELQQRLGGDWRALADALVIPAHDQRSFEAGFEARAIWEWLENRRRLDALRPALTAVGRGDLV